MYSEDEVLALVREAFLREVAAEGGDVLKGHVEVDFNALYAGSVPTVRATCRIETEG